MSEIRDTNQSSCNQIISAEDCDALINFPFHKYLSNIKTEPIDDLPVANLESNKGVGRSLSAECTTKDENYSNDDGDEVKCISLNRDLRRKLAHSCSILFAAEEKNRAKKNKLDEVGKETEAVQSKYSVKTKKSKPISLFAAPYFRDIKDMHPPDNEDTLAKLRNKDVTAYFQLPRPWIKFELDKLSQGVLENAMEITLQPFKEKEKYYKDKMKNLDGSARKKVKLRLKEIIEKRKKESQRPRVEIIKEVEDRIDWMQIAVRYLESARSYEECEAMWKNYASIFISKLPFSAEEDARLSKLVKKYNERNWDAIAEEMTGRSAIQCLERYQTCLNKALIKKYWTPEEDKKLMDVVESVKVGKFIPWNRVVSEMEGRERHQIINRYERTISKELKRSPWTKEEDAMLLACFSKFGPHWCKMREFFPGRNTYTLRERYVNILDPKLKCAQWTKIEDEKLISLIEEYGFGKWSKISKEMNGRTDNNCLIRARWLGIKPSLLGGVAGNEVNGFALSDDNYDNALILLKERFGREEIVVNAHMSKLLNLYPVKDSNNVIGLRKLYDICKIQIRSLESLNVTSGMYGHLLQPILLKLLPEDLVLDFNRKQLGKKEESTFDVMELLQFLKLEIECRESTHLLSGQGERKNLLTHNSKHIQTGYGDYQNISHNRQNKIQGRTSTCEFITPVNERDLQHCFFCNLDHLAEKCNKISIERKKKF
ncbi:transcription factor MYB3R-2 [Trichonephila inaurata madagascariensis]|uniref:Transcription factor MYB3R-2 n=1 Tax=Trichonephila inaurata madagascariensis TaxID=2747483 RepID=A0A8X6XX75_9ARAC|nr:transcription factor MYB3R-2 [Trichonephila inaurata madagascariensis]